MYNGYVNTHIKLLKQNLTKIPQLLQALGSEDIRRILRNAGHGRPAGHPRRSLPMSLYLILGLSVTMTLTPGLLEFIPAILPLALAPRDDSRVTVVGRPRWPADSIIKNGADLNSSVSAE